MRNGNLHRARHQPRGVPVSAEVSLGLVDEAIYALSAELVGSDLRRLLLRTRQPRAHLQQPGADPLAVGAGAWAAAATAAASSGGPRRDFPDTAAWFPALRTDFNGEATVTVTLPDSLTTWRLTARATTVDTQVGEATATHSGHPGGRSYARCCRGSSPRATRRPFRPWCTTTATRPWNWPSRLAAEPANGRCALRGSAQPDGDWCPRAGSASSGWPMRGAGWRLMSTLTVSAVPAGGHWPGRRHRTAADHPAAGRARRTTTVGQMQPAVPEHARRAGSGAGMSSVELQLSRSIAGSLLEGSGIPDRLPLRLRGADDEQGAAQRRRWPGAEPAGRDQSHAAGGPYRGRSTPASSASTATSTTTAAGAGGTTTPATTTRRRG